MLHTTAFIAHCQIRQYIYRTTFYTTSFFVHCQIRLHTSHIVAYNSIHLYTTAFIIHHCISIHRTWLYTKVFIVHHLIRQHSSYIIAYEKIHRTSLHTAQHSSYIIAYESIHSTSLHTTAFIVLRYIWQHSSFIIAYESIHLTSLQASDSSYIYQMLSWLFLNNYAIVCFFLYYIQCIVYKAIYQQCLCTPYKYFPISTTHPPPPHS